MSNSLAKAKAMAADSKVKARLDLLEVEFRLLRNRAAVYHMYRAYCMAPGWETLNLVEDQVQAYRETLEWLKQNSKARAWKDLRRPFNGNPYGMSFKPNKQESAPLNWDFNEIHAKGVLPAVDTSQQMKGGQGLAPYTSGNPARGATQPQAGGKNVRAGDDEKLFNETFDDAKIPFDQ
jgi:hypothetical protein